MELILTDFINGNIADIVLGIGVTVLGWSLNRIIKDNDSKIKDIIKVNSDEIERMNKHIENTDKELQVVKDNHNALRLDVVGKINETEKVLLAKISELSLTIEKQWRNNSKNL